MTGRIFELDLLFDAAGLDIVGVHEGRLSASQTLATANYAVTAAASVSGGNNGNQLWIAKRLAGRLHLEVHELSSSLMVAHGHAWHELQERQRHGRIQR